jgi:glycosyltransferase involved in cell wall biosynthesis
MKVSVLMPTYNHETFINQAIESFLAQVCNFEIELIIGNDASTDTTLEIAEEYAENNPNKIKLINHQSNQGLLQNYKSTIEVAQGEYFAILESDDYWTDNLKLQKQVDFLDANPDYGLCFTRWEKLKNNALTLQGDATQILSKNEERLYEYFLLRNIIFSPTTCFRRNLYEKYCNIDDYIGLDFKMFDYPVWLSLIRHAKIYFLNSPTAVYRVLGSSISNSTDIDKRLLFEENTARIRRYIISLYGSGSLTVRQIRIREIFVQARYAFRQKLIFKGLKILIFRKTGIFQVK